MSTLPNLEDHKHFLLKKDQQEIGYAHIQLWPENRAAIRIIVIDEIVRGNDCGRQFLAMIEDWLKKKGYDPVHTESSPSAYGFYKKHGYSEMPFNDPDSYESGPQDIAMGKVL